MKTILTFLMTCSVVSTFAQQNLKPAGGGEYKFPKAVCVTPEESSRIKTMLTTQIAQLKADGKIDPTWGSDQYQKPAGFAGFLWPLKQQDGFSYNSIYGVSNYVDLDLTYPDHVQDWNCGERTYDQASGYNHGGVDIYTWPFGQQQQADDQAVVIAATAGVIISKDDGHPDHSCSMSGGTWNAVYVGNVDGSISWYGHLKMGSLTSKSAGETVFAGEFLGIVGSSGNSTGPHLHFEVHDGDGNVVEPFNGPCNAVGSMWAEQKPYFEPTVNALMTHSAPPVFLPCPQLEIKNTKDTFVTGDHIFFGSYLHDQNDQNITYQVIAPGSTVHETWTHHLDAGLYYNSSYWYWERVVTNSWLPGVWQFKSTYEGKTVTHTFFVKEPTGIKNYAANEQQVIIYPNPTDGAIHIAGLSGMGAVAMVTIYNVLGQQVAVQQIKINNGTAEWHTDLAQGNYWLNVTGDNGLSKKGRLQIVR